MVLVKLLYTLTMLLLNENFYCVGGQLKGDYVNVLWVKTLDAIALEIQKWLVCSQGEPTPLLPPYGKNPEIGLLSIFKILTPNWISKISY